MGLFSRTPKTTPAHPDFPTATPDANRLALGFIQIRNSSGLWNDPTAQNLVQDPKLASDLREMWGLSSPEAWEANIDRMLVDRRRRPLWQELLQIRAAGIGPDGKAQSTKAWMKDIVAAGGTGKGEERSFVEAMILYENAFGAAANRTLFPTTVAVTSLDGYALNQAVGLAVWGVGMGLASPERSRERIAEANAIARREFGSWADFGRSVCLGRAMHWSDGHFDEKNMRANNPTAWDFERAMDPKIHGPWAVLPWQL